MVWQVRQNITIELIYPLAACCLIYTHGEFSVYLFYEHEREMCYESYKQEFQINSRCFHTIKPKLATQPAIVHDFFVTPSFHKLKY